MSVSPGARISGWSPGSCYLVVFMFGELLSCPVAFYLFLYSSIHSSLCQRVPGIPSNPILSQTPINGTSPHSVQALVLLKCTKKGRVPFPASPSEHRSDGTNLTQAWSLLSRMTCNNMHGVDCRLMHITHVRAALRAWDAHLTMLWASINLRNMLNIYVFILVLYLGLLVWRGGWIAV